MLGRSGALYIRKSRTFIISVVIRHNTHSLRFLFGVKSLSIVICVLITVILVPIRVWKHWSSQGLTFGLLSRQVLGGSILWCRSPAWLPIELLVHLWLLLHLLFECLLRLLLRILKVRARSAMSKLLTAIGYVLSVKTVINILLLQSEIRVYILMDFLVHRHSVDRDHVWWRNDICRGIKLGVHLLILLHGRWPFSVHISAILHKLLSIWTYVLAVNLLFDHIYWTLRIFRGLLSALLLSRPSILNVFLLAFGANFLTLLALYTFLGDLSF